MDKRKVRRDRADVFCTVEEGVKGRRALDWRLVDELAPQSKLDERVAARTDALAAGSRRAGPAKGIALTPLDRQFAADGLRYKHVSVDIDRVARVATITIRAIDAPPPDGVDEMVAQGAEFWPLALARELDDAILHLRNNEYEIGALVFKSSGDPALVAGYDAFLEKNQSHWLVHEIRHDWKRVFKRVDVTSRSLVALVEPGWCSPVMLAETVFADGSADQPIGQLRGRQPAACGDRVTSELRPWT